MGLLLHAGQRREDERRKLKHDFHAATADTWQSYLARLHFFIVKVNYFFLIAKFLIAKFEARIIN